MRWCLVRLEIGKMIKNEISQSHRFSDGTAVDDEQIGPFFDDRKQTACPVHERYEPARTEVICCKEHNRHS